MRASIIVVADPGADLLARVVEAEEQRFVQKLVAHAPVEALAEAVLQYPSGSDRLSLIWDFGIAA